MNVRKDRTMADPMRQEDFEVCRRELSPDDLETALAVSLHAFMASNFYDNMVKDLVEQALLMDHSPTKAQLELAAANLTFTKLRKHVQRCLGEETPIAFIERCFPKAYAQYVEANRITELLNNAHGFEDLVELTKSLGKS